MLHVLFRIGEADYVLPAPDVVQMESYDGATPVPGAPPWVAGLVQVRGRVLPVIDLRVRFGLPPAPPSLDRRVVVIRLGAREVGLLVDRAREIVQLEPDQFRPPPEVLAEQAAGFVRSVAQADRRLLLLVDPERLIGPGPLPKEVRDGQEASAG